MANFTTKDGTEIYYKDWGSGPTIVFSHGWPLNADAWDPQAYYFASNGFRCVAHDRRGHGRSSQPWNGNDMDTYADDLAELLDFLDVSDTVMIGHSTGGGEITRYMGRHGTGRVAKAILVSAVPPLMLKTESNAAGTPKNVFDDLRESYLQNRADFFLEFASGPFFGFNRRGVERSEGLIRSWWRQAMMTGYVSAYECVAAFSETDFTEDLKKIDVPTLIVHGDDDQVVPIQAAAKLSSKLVKDSTLHIYEGGPHALPDMAEERLNTDILEFIRG